MMDVVDKARYERHRSAGAGSFWLTALVFGSMGAIAWAVRGSGGWDGIDGTLIPGMTWALLWYYVCLRRGIDARGIILWLCLGIAVGGEWGYGQYTGWILGRFSVGEEVIPIAPWVGYAWFAICGVAWGAPGGIALGWALGGRASLGRWAARLVAPALLAWLGWLAVQYWPWLFFPNHGLGIYEGELGGHLERTVYTNTQNFVVLAWWIGALIVATVERDRFTLTAGGVIGGGFGLGFTLAALWCLGYDQAPEFIDWWKVWELNSGLYLGALYVVVLFWAMRQVDRAHEPDGAPRAGRDTNAECSKAQEWYATAFLGLGAFSVLYYTFSDHFYPTGLFLGLFYVVALALANHADLRAGGTGAKRRRQEISLAYSWFLLLFILLHGGSSRASVLIGLSDLAEVDQYQWPTARIGLFAAFAVPLLAGTLLWMGRVLWGPRDKGKPPVAPCLSDRMTLLMAGVSVAGAISIRPGKIGAFYALFLFLALFAFNRIRRRLDYIDGTAPDL